MSFRASFGSACASPCRFGVAVLVKKRCEVAFLLAADICRLTAPFGAESGSDLVPFTRHPLNNFLRDGRIVLAALESFVEQFNSEIGNLLSSAFGNLFFDFATPEFNVRNRRG